MGPEASNSEGMQIPIIVLGYSGQPKNMQYLSGRPEFETKCDSRNRVCGVATKYMNSLVTSLSPHSFFP
jgi:hypothetical protein